MAFDVLFDVLILKRWGKNLRFMPMLYNLPEAVKWKNKVSRVHKTMIEKRTMIVTEQDSDNFKINLGRTRALLRVSEIWPRLSQSRLNIFLYSQHLSCGRKITTRMAHRRRTILTMLKAHRVQLQANHFSSTEAHKIRANSILVHGPVLKEMLVRRDQYLSKALLLGLEGIWHNRWAGGGLRLVLVESKESRLC